MPFSISGIPMMRGLFDVVYHACPGMATWRVLVLSGMRGGASHDAGEADQAMPCRSVQVFEGNDVGIIAIAGKSTGVEHFH